MLVDITRMIFDRLLGKKFSEWGRQYDASLNEADKAAPVKGSKGIAYIPYLDADGDGAFKMAGLWYVGRYLADGKRFSLWSGRVFFDQFSPVDADELFTFRAIRDEKPVTELSWGSGRDWRDVVPAYALVRSVGSVRYREEGGALVYYDDSEESRDDWMYWQVKFAYMQSQADPLNDRSDSHWWSELFKRAIRAEHAEVNDAVQLTYCLRRLRWQYRPQIYETADGLRLRGGKEGTGAFLQKFLEQLGIREWFRAQMKEMVMKVDERGTVAAERVASGVGDDRGETQASVFASGAHDGNA